MHLILNVWVCIVCYVFQMFEKRLQTERALAEEKFEKKLLVWKKANLSSLGGAGGAAEAEMKDVIATEQRLNAAAIERINASHASAVAALNSKLEERTAALEAQRVAVAAASTAAATEEKKARDAMESDFQRQISALKTDISTRDRSISRIETQLSDAKAAAATAATAHAKELKELREQLNTTHSSAQATSTGTITSLQSKIKALEKQIDQLQKAADKPCMKCMDLEIASAKANTLQETVIKPQQSKIAELESKLAEERKESKRIDKLQAKYRKEYDDLKVVLKNKTTVWEKEAEA